MSCMPNFPYSWARANPVRKCARLHLREPCATLVKSQEILGAMLMTEHNIAFYQQLMQAMRDAIAEGRFAAFAAQFRSDYLG